VGIAWTAGSINSSGCRSSLSRSSLDEHLGAFHSTDQARDRNRLVNPLSLKVHASNPSDSGTVFIFEDYAGIFYSSDFTGSRSVAQSPWSQVTVCEWMRCLSTGCPWDARRNTVSTNSCHRTLSEVVVIIWGPCWL